jgi:uncharacterized protein (TIGR02246 family)
LKDALMVTVGRVVVYFNVSLRDGRYAAPLSFRNAEANPQLLKSGARAFVQSLPCLLFKRSQQEKQKMCSISCKSLALGAGRWALAAMSSALILAISAQAAEKKPKCGSEENAIRAAVESYVAAYNRGDAKAVASHWSESGDWISPSGERFRGRQAIQKEMESLFAENKGVKIEVINPSVRLVSPDVATEEGTVRVIRPEEPPRDATYLAIHVKKDGQWKLNSVRETDVPNVPVTSSRLQELAWLVGQWGDEGPDAEIAANVTWTKNKAFLTYAFKASAPGMDDLEGTQVIGWDPAAGTIRSWMFDSDGGFGEGIWSEKGNSWIVKFSQVLPDGRKASATNIYTLVDANTFTWKSIGRKVGEDFLPNVEEVKIVRKTASAATMKVPKATEKPLNRGTQN